MLNTKIIHELKITLKQLGAQYSRRDYIFTLFSLQFMSAFCLFLCCFTWAANEIDSFPLNVERSRWVPAVTMFLQCAFLYVKKQSKYYRPILYISMIMLCFSMVLCGIAVKVFAIVSILLFVNFLQQIWLYK